MTRDDFPYSLQPYAMPDNGGDGAQPSDAWTLVLFRAADEAERLWFRDHGFVMEGRRWVRHAPVPDSRAETPTSGDSSEDEDFGDRESDDKAPGTGGPAPDVAA
ncbi:hypothetical protein FW320_00725 [Azospirillum sp. Vi22]|uniref:hypothetical protein n=1 Tax=Azospirillum baldaniorum TaxID=1064539 RepID=UPI0011A079D3|nr:hypothetical protein [Azospirillum baldaniorum]NUB04717.1 hypothetical protein [Azospirillum baldaniorum]TWA70880.1 hypothetical protein FBZ84_102432 [Azospirillum baldaniorum]